MEKIMKNKKIFYGVCVAIIIIGIIVTYFLRLNFSLEYSENTRIDLYIGKEYTLTDIKQIAEDVFKTKQIMYRPIEDFSEAVSITVREASDEQIESLKTKIQEKYELENTDSLIEKQTIGHFRGRDIVKPYIVPMVTTTIVVLIYVGIRYMKLGTWKTIYTLLIRLIISQALILSLIAITRIPIGSYTMPIDIGLYILVIVLTIMGYQKDLEKMITEEN